MSIDLAGLSIAQKLELVENLWDDIASHPASVPVADWLKDELSRRKAEYLLDPSIAVSWDEAKESILSGGS